MRLSENGRGSNIPNDLTLKHVKLNYKIQYIVVYELEISVN